MTLRSFWIRRIQFTQLMSSNSSMTMSRYLRLMLLATIDMMCTVPLGVYTIYLGNQGVQLAPWISWEDTHYDFSHVGRVPNALWRSDSSFRTSVEMTRWLPVLCALLFFALFGFAQEARKVYKKALLAVLHLVGIKSDTFSQKSFTKGFPYVFSFQFTPRSHLILSDAQHLDQVVKADSQSSGVRYQSAEVTKFFRCYDPNIPVVLNVYYGAAHCH